MSVPTKSIIESRRDQIFPVLETADIERMRFHLELFDAPKRKSEDVDKVIDLSKKRRDGSPDRSKF